MGYQLGVDLGTTYSAAAIGRNGRVEVTTLGTANPVMPSVVLLRADGEVLVGEVAVRRGLAEPTRVAREFKRRLGDPTPLVLGGTPYGAESLMGHLLHAIVATVAEREGEQPERVVLTHPANYGPYKLEQMREVARLAGLDLEKTSFLTEPQAAAVSYATRNRVEPGEVVAIYDFGGGTFDAALVQRTDSGFELIGRPEGMERFGGIDIDAALIAHVDQSLDGALTALDPSEPEVQSAISRLREDCRSAKEALSGDTDTSITVSMPGMQTQVRLTRAELEDMVRPRLVETVDALERAVRSAGLTMDRVSRVLLVGGSSRMPIVGELIRQRTGRPISVDAHPKFAIALGAAGHGMQTGAPAAVPGPSAGAPVPPPPPVSPAVASAVPAAGGAVTAAAPIPAPSAPSAPSGGKKPSRNTLIAIGAVVAVIIGLVVFLTTRGGDDDPAIGSDDTEETDDTARKTDETDETTPETDETPPPDDTAPASSIPITPDQFDGTLLTLADVGPEFIESTFSETGEDICGVFPVHQPLLERTVAFQKGTDATDFISILNQVGYYASTADADEVLEQEISLIESCDQEQFETIGGTEFRVLAVVTRFGQQILQGISPTCLDGALVLQTFTPTDPANTTTFTANIAVLRCANVLTAVNVTPGSAELSTEATALLSSALSASANKVSRIQLIP